MDNNAPSAIVFQDDDAAYLHWRGAHLRGFVLNCARRPTPDYLVLHKASCGSFASAVGDGRSWTVAYMKVCSDAASTIESWCRRQVGAEPQRCGVCHP